MAGNRRRRQDNSGVHAFLYVLVVLVLLCGMGYLFYYSRSQANERQEYIRELESKEAATKDVVQVTVPAEPESETISEAESSMPEAQTETQTETQTEIESESEFETESHLESESETTSETESAKSTEADLFSADNPRIIVLNGTGKAGVAAYWKRFLQGKGFTNVVMADYKGEISDHTVVYVTAGGNAPEGVYDLFPNAEYREEGLDSADPNADTNVKIPDSQKKFDFYDVWILVGKDDALHD
ncbi:MAG: LytR C-terminal domain-containing protein [Lachnospiraceae bacterium]